MNKVYIKQVEHGQFGCRFKVSNRRKPHVDIYQNPVFSVLDHSLYTRLTTYQGHSAASEGWIMLRPGYIDMSAKLRLFFPHELPTFRNECSMHNSMSVRKLLLFKRYLHENRKTVLESKGNHRVVQQDTQMSLIPGQAALLPDLHVETAHYLLIPKHSVNLYNV